MLYSSSYLPLLYLPCTTDRDNSMIVEYKSIPLQLGWGKSMLMLSLPVQVLS